jgi:quercetin dioxygenase-like cupin family protein
MGAMRVTPLDDALRGEPMDPEHFTGPASSRPLHATPEANPVRVSVVRFQAGTRNHWHAHSGGQLLHVVEGEGYVQARGGPLQRLRAGDSVSTAPGEEHWHGAGRGSPMAHIAVTIGDITWKEAPPEPD